MFDIMPRTPKCQNRKIKKSSHAGKQRNENRCFSLGNVCGRMNETLATKEDIKMIHGRLNNLAMMVVSIGFLNIVAAITARLLT